MQTEALWKFMQSDLDVDRFENEMRQSPLRAKYMKQRNSLVDMQAANKKLEEDVVAMYDRLEAVKDEAERLAGQLASLLASIGDTLPEDLEELRKQEAAVSKLEGNLQRYEQELTRMRKDSDLKDKQQKDIRLRAARVKAELDKVKEEYDAEFKRDKTRLEQLRAAAEKASKLVDEHTLARYRATKQHVTPPLARMNGNRCGGCNMDLPAAMLVRLKAGEELECDNCGRILIAE